MKHNLFVQRYIILPCFVTMLFISYCAADVALNFPMHNTMENKMEQAYIVPEDVLAFTPPYKPNKDAVEVAGL